LVIAPALIVSALFPYVIVNQPPRFSGLWETRHQTTLMMVSGFVIFSLLRLIIPRRFLWKAAAALCAVFLLIDMSTTHQLIADALETRAVTELFKQHPSPPGTMMFVIENDREYRALDRFQAFYELSSMINASEPGGPRLALSNREVLDPSTGSYPDKLIPAATAALVALCPNRVNPQYGFGGFVSNGQVETVKLITNRPRPKIFETIYDAIRIIGDAEPIDRSKPMVRMESEMKPIGGACASPCCKDS
jgi:hypothetical protein